MWYYFIILYLNLYWFVFVCFFLFFLIMWQSHPEFEGLESLWAYLRFVPLEDEILDFFRPVAARILQQLRATSCIPISLSQSSKKGEKEFLWWCYLLSLSTLNLRYTHWNKEIRETKMLNIIIKTCTYVHRTRIIAG